MNKLTAKQERFVAEYLIDLNATQAAIRAGYAEKGAAVEGSRLLANPKVAAAVAAAKAERTERTEITQDYVLNTIRDTSFACMRYHLRSDRRQRTLYCSSASGRIVVPTPGKIAFI